MTSDMTIEERLRMLEVRTSQIRKRADQLHEDFAVQTEAMLDNVKATRALMESVGELQKMVQGHTRDVRTVDAHLAEILERLRPEDE